MGGGGTDFCLSPGGAKHPRQFHSQVETAEAAPPATLWVVVGSLHPGM